MKDRCPTCGLALERGESSDFWIGAYVFNLVGGELIAIGIPIVWIIVAWPAPPWTKSRSWRPCWQLAFPLYSSRSRERCGSRGI